MRRMSADKEVGRVTAPAPVCLHVEIEVDNLCFARPAFPSLGSSVVLEDCCRCWGCFGKAADGRMSLNWTEVTAAWASVQAQSGGNSAVAGWVLPAVVGRIAVRAVEHFV